MSRYIFFFLLSICVSGNSKYSQRVCYLFLFLRLWLKAMKAAITPKKEFPCGEYFLSLQCVVKNFSWNSFFFFGSPKPFRLHMGHRLFSFCSKIFVLIDFQASVDFQASLTYKLINPSLFKFILFIFPPSSFIFSFSFWERLIFYDRQAQIRKNLSHISSIFYFFKKYL